MALRKPSPRRQLPAQGRHVIAILPSNSAASPLRGRGSRHSYGNPVRESPPLRSCCSSATRKPSRQTAGWG